MQVKNRFKGRFPLIILMTGLVMLLAFLAIFFGAGCDLTNDAIWLQALFVIAGFGGTILVILGLYLIIRRELKEIRRKRLEVVNGTKHQ